MKLTTEQRSEIISEMASSEADFNELMRVLLDSFSKQERALFLEEHKGEQGNGFRPRRWRGHGCSFQLRIPRTRSGAFQPIILGMLGQEVSEPCPIGQRTQCGLFHLSEVFRKCAPDDLFDQLGRTPQSLLQAHLAHARSDAFASVVYLLGSVAKEKTEGTDARRLPYFREWKIK